MVKDVEPATTIFCTSQNYVYNTALNCGVPYDVKVLSRSGKAGTRVSIG